MLDLKKEHREEFIKKVTSMANAVGYKVINFDVNCFVCVCFRRLPWKLHKTN